MKPILIVSATTQKSGDDTLLARSLKMMKCDNNSYRVEFHTSNTKGLPKLYNKYLNTETHADHDIILFVHDDVFIDDSRCFEKLHDVLSSCDIAGVAGGSQMRISKPALWHVMVPREHQSGAVMHYCDDNKKIKHTTSFGPVPKRCVVVDGLFMAVKLETVLQTQWRFNEQFDFHHYDIAACIDANKNKLKITTCDIHLLHSSPGLLDYNDKPFNKSEKKFLELYSK